MTFAEKARLAKQYLDIFQMHHMIFTIGGILLLLIGIILGFIIFELIHKKNYETLLLDIPSALCVICGIIILMIGNIADAPQYDKSRGTCPDSMQLDANIVHIHHQLPKYQHQAKIDYQKSLKLHGAKQYYVDHAYCKAHHHAILEKKYLRIHKPQAPWING